MDRSTFEEFQSNLGDLIEPVKSVVETQVPAKCNGNGFDIVEFLTRHGIQYRAEPINDGTKYILAECLFNPEHKSPDAAVIQKNDGKLGYHCFHDSCSPYEWKHARGKLDPGYRNQKSTAIGQEETSHNQPAATGEVGFEPVLTRLSDITSRPVEWLWPRRIAKGKLTLLAGDPGIGKSFITLDLATRVSRGRPWPDGSAAGPSFVDTTGSRNELCYADTGDEEREHPTESEDCEDSAYTSPDTASGASGNVLILSAEDDMEDTIRPRLDAMGADCSRIHVMTTIRLPNGKLSSFNLTRDLPSLDAAVKTVNAQFVIIDPITAYLGGTDSHKNADVRALLAPLSELAARHRVAVLVVTHLNKGAGGSAIYRATGSLAFIAAARAGYLVVKDREDSSRRLFLPIKNNLGTDTGGLAYSIENGTIAWEPGIVEISADEAIGADRGGREEKSAIEKQWLRSKLGVGKRSSRELLAEAEDLGFKEKRIRKAFRELGGETCKDGFQGYWYWGLPSQLSSKCQIEPNGNMESSASLDS